VLPTREQPVREKAQAAALTIVLAGTHAPPQRKRDDAITTTPQPM